MSRPHDHLAIISVPFYRIARVSLSDRVLGTLLRTSDVAIVAPFAGEAGFQKNFGAPGTVFLSWTLNALDRRQRALLAASEIMRRNGYWRRFRARGMAYYLKNQYTVFGTHGKDTRLPFGLRAAYGALGSVGRTPASWKLADRLLGERWARFPELVELARRYARVTLIQSANWGLQDRALATVSATQGWRKVLLPYTSDQLDVNGYLLNAFDAVCVQGPYEEQLARELHGVAPHNTYRLGSVWFRHLEDIKGASQPASPGGFVLYAGVSATYFPRASEFAAVDAIIGLLARSKERLTLVYRPVEPDEARREEIRKRYEREEASGALRLEWPPISQLGLEQYAEVDHNRSLREYVHGLAGCKLVVMSSLTSLAMDVAFVERCGVIANFADPSGVLERRHTGIMSLAALPGVRVVSSVAQLLENAQHLLTHPQQAADEAGRLVAHWDYPATDFERCLRQAVYGRAATG